jgi:hypothetical protein
LPGDGQSGTENVGTNFQERPHAVRHRQQPAMAGRESGIPTTAAHYSKSFFTKGADYDAWANHKRRVQASKPDVEIKLSNVSMLRYPNSKQEMAVVNFEQSFKSNHLNNTMRKRQYWVLENNRWKIKYEGPA